MVTNHALLAIDAIADVAVLPEHELLVVDEAHELVDRVTWVATGELSATTLGVAPRRDRPAGRARNSPAAGGGGGDVLLGHPRRRTRAHRHLDDELATYLTALRDAATTGPLGDRHRARAIRRRRPRATRR